MLGIIDDNCSRKQWVCYNSEIGELKEWRYWKKGDLTFNYLDTFNSFYKSELLNLPDFTLKLLEEIIDWS